MKRRRIPRNSADPWGLLVGGRFLRLNRGPPVCLSWFFSWPRPGNWLPNGSVPRFSPPARPGVSICAAFEKLGPPAFRAGNRGIRPFQPMYPVKIVPPPSSSVPRLIGWKLVVPCLLEPCPAWFGQVRPARCGIFAWAGVPPPPLPEVAGRACGGGPIVPVLVRAPALGGGRTWSEGSQLRRGIAALLQANRCAAGNVEPGYAP